MTQHRAPACKTKNLGQQKKQKCKYIQRIFVSVCILITLQVAVFQRSKRMSKLIRRFSFVAPFVILTEVFEKHLLYKVYFWYLTANPLEAKTMNRHSQLIFMAHITHALFDKIWHSIFTGEQLRPTEIKTKYSTSKLNIKYMAHEGSIANNT